MCRDRQSDCAQLGFTRLGSALQAEQVKLISLKVRDKFYREPQSESAMWARKHMPDLGAPLPGLGQQTLPATMPSIDFRLVWHTGNIHSTLHAVQSQTPSDPGLAL